MIVFCTCIYFMYIYVYILKYHIKASVYLISPPPFFFPLSILYWNDIHFNTCRALLKNNNNSVLRSWFNILPFSHFPLQPPATMFVSHQCFTTWHFPNTSDCFQSPACCWQCFSALSTEHIATHLLKPIHTSVLGKHLPSASRINQLICMPATVYTFLLLPK